MIRLSLTAAFPRMMIMENMPTVMLTPVVSVWACLMLVWLVFLVYRATPADFAKVLASPNNASSTHASNGSSGYVPLSKCDTDTV